MSPSLNFTFIPCIKRSQGLPTLHLIHTFEKKYYSDLCLYERDLSDLSNRLPEPEGRLCLVSHLNSWVDLFVILCSLKEYLRRPTPSLCDSFTRLPQSRQIS